MVPAVSEVWRRQALHWNSWRDRISLAPLAADRALKTLRPARPKEHLAAGRFSAVPQLELSFAEPLLELHRVAGHGYPFANTPMFLICTLAWLAEEAV